MSEEIALAAADLETVSDLRARVLEWEATYDRLLGAFDLHMDILDCKQAMSDYAGVFYDVLLGDLADRADQCQAALAVATDENDGLHAQLRRADMARKAAIEIGARGSGVIQAARAYRTAITTLNGIGAAEQALWLALDSYDAAEKARINEALPPPANPAQ